MIFVVNVLFTWGEKSFSFPMEHEAQSFKSAILLCREAILATSICEVAT